jgi:hypothetical protein
MAMRVSTPSKQGKGRIVKLRNGKMRKKKEKGGTPNIVVGN